MYSSFSEITETRILWSYNAEIRKSGEGNGSRMCTRLQNSWGWTDDITEWTGMKINEDRDRWRGILRAANPSYGGWH